MRHKESEDVESSISLWFYRHFVLYTAIVEKVDILITGDKDFAAVEVKRTEILTPAEYIKTRL